MAKIIKRILIAAILVGLLVGEILYIIHPSQYEKLNFVKQEYERIHKSNIELERKNKKLKKMISSLKSCGKYCEQVARDELGMIKEDETIYILPK